MPVDNKELLQQLIGPDYHLQWIIGHGGMSTVWLADDTVNAREVAIKVLRPEFSNNDEFLERFRNEATAAENIHSENVVATYDYREIPDPAGHTSCFIVMEYIRGESLADLLAREGSLDEDIALDVLQQTAHGLSIIHRMGLVHRDIKPGNLLITQNGQVKITDFGIAKAAAAVPLTRTGMVVGTAQYVSPEQAQGMEVTAASDVYSLGVVGYEMLAGHRPFTGDSGVSVALAHVNNAPPPLPTSISAETRELIGIALRKDPNTRYSDGNEFALATEAVRGGQRPPQPESAMLNQVSQEPSPTASTHMLGQVAQPTTIHPAEGRPTSAMTYEQARATERMERERQKKNSGFGIGLLIAAILAVLAAIGVWFAARAGVLGGDTTPSSTTPSSPQVVTQWVTPSTSSSAPTTTSQEQVYTETVTTEPTTERAPERTTYSPEPPTTEAPAPAPAPSSTKKSSTPASTTQDQPKPQVNTPSPIVGGR